MPKSVCEQVVVIAGASTGIGRVTALAFAARGELAPGVPRVNRLRRACSPKPGPGAVSPPAREPAA